MTWDPPFDEVPDEDRDDEPREVACMCCGKRGLEWVNIGGSKPWRLFEGNKLHKCKPDASDFGPIEDETK